MKLFPGHPSPLNNRAQIYRLLHKKSEALKDLDEALALPDVEAYPLVMRQVYTQRGWVHFVEDNLEQAKADFEKAYALGNKEAHQLALRCNPYAAMCNAMLAEIVQKAFSL